MLVFPLLLAIVALLDPGSGTYNLRGSRARQAWATSKDSPEAKSKVADYVAENFFSSKEPTYSFVQASVTSIHLGKILADKKTLRPGSLIHTNSIVFPLIMLQDRGDISVYAFCGSSYDNLCGGWLPSSDDSEARKYLRGLFDVEKQGTSALKDSFITPIATTYDDGKLYFTRSELVSMIQTLGECCTGQIVVMTFFSRVFETRPHAQDQFLHANLLSVELDELIKDDKSVQIHLIIAHDYDKRSTAQRSEVVQKLRGLGYQVRWQNDDLNWQLS